MSGFVRVMSVEGQMLIRDTGLGERGILASSASWRSASMARQRMMFEPDESPMKVTVSPASAA